MFWIINTKITLSIKLQNKVIFKQKLLCILIIIHTIIKLINSKRSSIIYLLILNLYLIIVIIILIIKIQLNRLL